MLAIESTNFMYVPSAITFITFDFANLEMHILIDPSFE